MTVINKKFTPPSLPTAPVDYDQRQIDQFQYALRLYFNQLDGYLADLTNLLNTGQTFDNITANNITTENITVSQDVDTFNLNAQNEVQSDLVQANRFLGGNYVGNNYMGANFYGGNFYGNGKFIETPYNQIISNTDQAAVALDVAYAITYDTTDFPDGITVTSNSRITFADTGIYNITYSIQFENDNNSTETVDIWLRYKGTNMPGTNSRFSLPPRKSIGVPSTLIAVTPLMVDIEADGDYIEIMWHPSDLGVTIEHYNAVAASPGVTPAIPATPSVIIGVTFISAQFPPAKRVAPLGVLGTGQVGSVIAQ